RWCSEAGVRSDIDEYGLAGHVGVRIGDEERGKAGDLLDRADAAERAVLEVVGETVVWEVAPDAVLEEPGGEAEDADPVPGDLFGESFGEALDRGLAGAIVDGRLDHADPGERADVQ